MLEAFAKRAEAGCELMRGTLQIQTSLDCGPLQDVDIFHQRRKLDIKPVNLIQAPVPVSRVARELASTVLNSLPSSTAPAANDCSEHL